MTQKELLYVEDAIGHEQTIIAVLEDTISNLQDEALVSFIRNELKKHNSMNEKLMKTLEDNANE